jgi:platelet-activating factor acetylhydrolase IB subunit alpha
MLSARQQKELNCAVLAYMRAQNLNAAADAFAADVDDAAVVTAQAAEAKFAKMLTTKWRSVIRLQRRVLELEKTEKRLNTELAEAYRSGGRRKVDTTATLPGDDARSQRALKGHRDAVTAVAFHPAFSLVASASDDASVRLWDCESGKFERSLTGHQDAVTGVAFSAQGTHLATASVDASAKIWDVETRQVSSRVQSRSVLCHLFALSLLSNKCMMTLHGHYHTVSGVS